MSQPAKYYEFRHYKTGKLIFTLFAGQEFKVWDTYDFEGATYQVRKVYAEKLEFVVLRVELVPPPSI